VQSEAARALLEAAALRHQRLVQVRVRELEQEVEVRLVLEGGKELDDEGVHQVLVRPLLLEQVVAEVLVGHVPTAGAAAGGGVKRRPRKLATLAR